jgi:hypothetical protein
MSASHKGFDDPSPTIAGTDRLQKVYRIMDFFSAAQTIKESSLYVPLASSFDDRNEAIDAAVGHLAVSAGPCAGITSYFSTIEDFIRHQRSVADRHYVSCWTKTKESVAMWALYSKDCSSIQLSTTVENLERAAITLAGVQSDPRLAICTGNGEGQFLDRSKIAAIKYDDFSSVARTIDRRRRAYDKLDAAQKISHEAHLGSPSKAENRRAAQYRFETLEHKDSSFAHESEVRLILAIAPYNEDTLAVARSALADMSSRPDTDSTHSEYERGMLLYARAVLREEAWKRRLACRPSISLPLHAGFVTDVTIDPRCPPHKRRFMRSYFEDLGIHIVESRCFGHAADSFVVTPRRSLLERKR